MEVGLPAMPDTRFGTPRPVGSPPPLNLRVDATEGQKLQQAGAVGAIIVQSLSDRSRGRLTGLGENFRDDLPVRMTTMVTFVPFSYTLNVGMANW